MTCLNSVRRLPSALAFVLLLGGAFGCLHSRPQPDSEARKPAAEASNLESISVMVARKGETLSSIAKRYTGSGENWRKIAKANPAINPQRIRIGQRLVIPGTLLLADARKSRSDIVAPADLMLIKGKKSDASEQLLSSPARQQGDVPPSQELAQLTPTSVAGSEQRAALDRRPDAQENLPGSSKSGAGRSRIEEARIEEARIEEEQLLALPQVVEKDVTEPVKKAAQKTKTPASAKRARYRVIASSGYGSLNREVSHLDAELAKAEALAAELRKQQADLAGADGKAAHGEKNFFSCSKNNCLNK